MHFELKSISAQSIPEALAKIGAHGVEDLRQNRCRGVVIEVNPLHRDQALFYLTAVVQTQLAASRPL